MTLKTYGDWFTGFGGMTLGAIDAGPNVVFGAEYDPKIAEVYRLNIGDHIRVCNLLEVDVSEFPRVDVFHASPPCPNFSNAKTNGKETDNDIALSAKVAEYIAYHLPDAFTLENVYQYRNSKSWQAIAKTLHDNGYLFNYWHVNMASYGVPQTRKRMIVIARRDGVMPTLPPTTHAKEPEVGMFGGLEKWVGWYEAIEDLIPELPDCEFAPWQLDRLPGELKTSLIDVRNTGRELTILDNQSPSFTVQSSAMRRPVSVSRAYIVNTREMHLSDSGANYTARGNDEPVYTLSATSHASRNKAFIVDGLANLNGSAVTVLAGSAPSFTVKASASKHASRAFATGRVVQMTPRCLARFQSFPDCYVLPEQKKLACQGIGNAVPPLFAGKLYKHLLQQYSG